MFHIESIVHVTPVPMLHSIFTGPAFNKKNRKMEAHHAKNSAIYVAIAALLFAILVWLKSLLQLCMSGAYAIGALIVFLKISLKLLPLLLALVAEFFFSRDERFSWRRLLQGGKSSVIDLYCFALHNLHKLAGWLNIVFTFGIAFFRQRYHTPYSRTIQVVFHHRETYTSGSSRLGLRDRGFFLRVLGRPYLAHAAVLAHSSLSSFSN